MKKYTIVIDEPGDGNEKIVLLEEKQLFEYMGELINDGCMFGVYESNLVFDLTSRYSSKEMPPAV